jgi:hypothetical protein
VVFALVAGGCGTKTVTRTRTVTVAAPAKVGAGPPGTYVEFGYIESLARDGARYRMRFDPALMLSGETANVAAAEDGAVEPGDPVPNDNYVINEDKRLLTYSVAPDARVTVLKSGVQGSRVTVEQLARLVSGHNAPFKPWEPLTTGFWIVVNIDTVRALDQQYRP